MLFREHLSNEMGLADLLNYAHVIADGIIINKDGAFLTTYKFSGPDLNSAVSAELDALTHTFSRMVTILEDGWMLHIDELRQPSVSYPFSGLFPTKVAALLEAERRQIYQAEGSHFENLQFLTFVWKFPLSVIRDNRHWFVEGVTDYAEDGSLTKILQTFENTIERCINLLSSCLVLKKLTTHDLLVYLNTCISGKPLPVALPPDGCFIDVALGRYNVIAGYLPKIDDRYIYALSVLSYLNSETIPGMLDEIVTYPMVYRWSNRFIPLSEATAEHEIKRYQKNWSNKVKGFMGIAQEAMMGRNATKINADAVQMRDEASQALTINSNHTMRFGYWTSTIILHTEQTSIADQAIKDLRKYLEQRGFSCILEDVNAFDAWLGSIPGHGSCNVRRLFLTSANLAHVLPLNTIWTGASFSSNASLLPAQSPPVFYAATTGKTPFRFHLDVADVGHQLVLGPTGAGKSTYLDFLIAQFLRYQNAQIFVFDKDYSHQALTAALDGCHYDVGNAEQLSFCPLADLSTETKKIQAEQFIEKLVLLQNITITPEIRTAIHQAINSLAHEYQQNNRNLTIFRAQVQNEQVRAALQYYTLDGSLKILDATYDGLQTGYLQTFEMSWLLNQRPEIYLPILLYIFSQIETRLEDANGKNPTLIVLEEAWLYISHEIFAKQLRDWLKTLRKKNARVIFVTQSLSDLYDPTTKTLSGITATLLESCPTKLYLPNQNIDNEIHELYKKMGLNDRQIEIINKISIPKKNYYVVTPQGNRLIDLGFHKNSIALNFLGLSKEKSRQLITCKQTYGENWLEQWLAENKQVER